MREAAKLTDHQRRFLNQHAASLPGMLRDGFRRTVTDRLAGEPSDNAVAAAVAAALSSLSFSEDRS